MQVARRIKDERRIKDGESKGGEDLDEEQGRGSFGDVGEPAFPGGLCGFHAFPWRFDWEWKSTFGFDRAMPLFLSWNRSPGNSGLPEPLERHSSETGSTAEFLRQITPAPIGRRLESTITLMESISSPRSGWCPASTWLPLLEAIARTSAWPHRTVATNAETTAAYSFTRLTRQSIRAAKRGLSVWGIHPITSKRES